MKRNKSSLKLLAVLAAAAAAAGAWAPVFGSALYSIGVLNTNSGFVASQVLAISSDGTWACGYSPSAGLYSGGSSQGGAPATTNAPVIWSIAGGLQELPNPNGTHCIAYGVDTTSADPTNGLPGIVLAGLHEHQSVSRIYKAQLSSPASGTWLDTATYVLGGCGANWPSASLGGGDFNDLRRKPGTAGTWFTAVEVNSSGRACTVRGDPICGGDDVYMAVWSVSGFGVQVGRSTASTSTAEWASTAENGSVPGSSGYRADGIGISTSFGTNDTDFANQWVCGQVANYNGTSMQAFRWQRGAASMVFLGTFSGDTSSCAYTIADNGVTAGRTYNSTSSNVAAVWDTSGTWDTSGQCKRLTDLLAADGVDTNAWTKLADVYACSQDGKVLGGWGIWAADGSARGFVAIKTTTCVPVVHITSVTVGGGTVTVGFTSTCSGDVAGNFAVQSEAALVNGVNSSFADINPAATISGSAGSFQAQFSTSGSTQFYRIRHHP